jgi:predicted  nucleic acid-binding Zn-ribbon protein
MTAKEVSIKLKISLRTTQLICKDLDLPKYRNRYIITENDLEKIKNKRDLLKNELQIFSEYLERNERETKQNETNINTEYRIEQFTEQEYTEFQKRLIEYNILHERIGDLKNEVQYLRKSLDKQAEQMETLLNSFNNTIASIRERNAIEYKKQNETE